MKLIGFRPCELVFPFRENCGHGLCITLENLTNELVAYKIKTNKRDKYFISPFQGIIAPHQEASCVIVMDAQEYYSSVVDKFLLQSVAVQDADLNVTTLWRSLERRRPSKYEKAVVHCRLDPEPQSGSFKSLTMSCERSFERRHRYTEDFSYDYSRGSISRGSYLRSLSCNRPPRKKTDPIADRPPPFRHDRRNFDSHRHEPRPEPEYCVEGITRYLHHPQLAKVNIEEKLAFLRRQNIADAIILTALKKYLNNE